MLEPIILICAMFWIGGAVVMLKMIYEAESYTNEKVTLRVVLLATVFILFWPVVLIASYIDEYRAKRKDKTDA